MSSNAADPATELLKLQAECAALRAILIAVVSDLTISGKPLRPMLLGAGPWSGSAWANGGAESLISAIAGAPADDPAFRESVASLCAAVRDRNAASAGAAA